MQVTTFKHALEMQPRIQFHIDDVVGVSVVFKNTQTEILKFPSSVISICSNGKELNMSNATFENFYKPLITMWKKTQLKTDC